MFFVAVRKDICILLTYISGNSFLSSTLTATTTIIIFLLLINREENHRKEKVKPCSFERSFIQNKERSLQLIMTGVIVF